MNQSVPQPFPLRDAAGLLDPVWSRIRQEAEAAAAQEPELAGFLHAAVLQHESLESALASRVAARLDHADLPTALLRRSLERFLEEDPALREAVRSDIMAVVDRDPATSRALEPLLYYKGFHALTTHRMAHILWRQGRRDRRCGCSRAVPWCSRRTSTRRCGSAAASSSTTPRASWWARRR
ncbi:serine O-acetyltransferase [Teichococcus aestuarii]